MKLKFIKCEDFINYKKPSMFIGTCFCNFKCCIEANIPKTVCQNEPWFFEKNIDIEDSAICNLFISNRYTQAICFGGLEPMDQFDEIFNFIYTLRNDFKNNSDVVIYTGYNENECQDKINQLKQFKNIIVKFGRFVPNQEKHLDPILGVHLASPNQYAKKIS